MRIRRYARNPFALICGGIATYTMNRAWLRPIMLNDLEEMKLAEKYFSLDLNADAMRADLDTMGISIQAKYFNLEEA